MKECKCNEGLSSHSAFYEFCRCNKREPWYKHPNSNDRWIISTESRIEYVDAKNHICTVQGEATADRILSTNEDRRKAWKE